MKMVTILPRFARAFRFTNFQLARQFKSPFLREVMENLFDKREKSMVLLAFPMAYYDARCAGYPLGGSRAFIQRVERRYLELGGEITYRAPVAEVTVTDDRATGVRLKDGSLHEADVVVSAADGRWTIFDALGGQYVDEATRELYAGERLDVYSSLILTSLGVARTFPGAPPVEHIALPEPWVLPDGTEITRVSVRNYSYDPSLAPAGKTVLSVLLNTHEHGYWHALQRDDKPAYKAAKRAVSDYIVQLLESRFGGIRDVLEVVDVVTPATIADWTGNWQGSYQGWMPGSFRASGPLPKQLPGLRDLWMVGQWVEPGGGLPPALLSGRNMAQELLAQAGLPFVVVPRPPSSPSHASAAASATPQSTGAVRQARGPA
jgi:phytoene dehydrogenase-like protein